MLSLLSARHIADSRRHGTDEYFSLSEVDGDPLGGPLLSADVLSDRTDFDQRDLHQLLRCGIESAALYHLPLLHRRSQPGWPGSQKQSVGRHHL